VSALKRARTARFGASEREVVPFVGSVSTTVPFEVHEPLQLPLPTVSRTSMQGVSHGLTVKFMLDFARALAMQGTKNLVSSQIKVILLGR